MAGKKEEKKGKGMDFTNMSVEEIVAHREEVKTLLSSLEDEYRKASITEASYKELKEKNRKRLDEVNTVLTDWGIKDDNPLPTGITASAASPPTAATPAASAAATPASPAKPGQPSQPATASPVIQSTDPATAMQPPLPSASAARSVVTEQPRAAPMQSMAPDFGNQLQGMLTASLGMQKELLENKIAMELEKINVQVSSLKESKGASDERLQRVMETIGEIRSTVMQREAALSKEEALVKKIDDQVATIKPTEIAKEFAKRDKPITDLAMRADVLEDKVGLLNENMSHVQTLLRTIGGIENIAAMSKSMTAKINLVEDYLQKIDRMSDKVEKIFMDMNKKMEDFVLYKTKQETMDDLVKDLMKGIDSLTVKTESFMTKEDMNPVRTELGGLMTKLDETKKILNMLVPIVQMKMPEKIEKLKKERDDITVLLSTMEEQQKSGGLGQEEYLQTRSANEKKLEEINALISEEWNRFQPAAPAAPQPTTNQPAAATPPTAAPTTTPASQPAAKAEKPDAKPEQPSVETKKNDKPGPLKAKKPAKAKPANDGDNLLAELDDSFKRGLISEKAYQRTKKMLGV